MKQYCKYCVWLCTSNGIYCDKREKYISENTAKKVNNCENFCFCSIDAFNPNNKYKPREKKSKQIDGQINFLDMFL